MKREILPESPCVSEPEIPFHCPPPPRNVCDDDNDGRVTLTDRSAESAAHPFNTSEPWQSLKYFLLCTEFAYRSNRCRTMNLSQFFTFRLSEKVVTHR